MRRARNPEQARVYQRRYYLLHKEERIEQSNTARAVRRARRYGVDAERIGRGVLYERDKGKCGICGGAVAHGQASTDHIVPISMGGSHTWANVQLAHTNCNRRRGAARLPAQMRLDTPFRSIVGKLPPASRMLTPETVRQIRMAVGTYRGLATVYGVSWSTVRDIRKRRTWAALP